MPDVTALALGGFAALLSTAAALFSAVAWWRSDGRRLATIERHLITSLAAVTARQGEVDSIIARQRLEFAGLVEESVVHFERAESSRKRGQADRIRAEAARAVEAEAPAPVVDIATLPRDEQLRLVRAENGW